MKVRSVSLVVAICCAVSVSPFAVGSAGAVTVKITIHADHTSPNIGDAVHITGIVSPVDSRNAGRKVQLQQRISATGWRTVKSASFVRSSGNRSYYDIAIKPASIGVFVYRTVWLHTSSGTVTVTPVKVAR